MSDPCNHTDLPKVAALEPRKCKICDLTKYLYEMSPSRKDRSICTECITARNKASKVRTTGKQYMDYVGSFSKGFKKRKY